MFDLLLIDDTPAVRKQLARVFGERLSGYRLHQAGDRAEALRTLQATSPNLVLLDLVMPSARGQRDAEWTAGRDLLKATRRGWPQTRVVVLTSEETRVRQFLVEEGADDFFAKSELNGPGLWKLVGVVENLIGHFPNRAEGSAAAWAAVHNVGADSLAVVSGEAGVGRRTLAHCIAAQLLPHRTPRMELACQALARGLDEAATDGLATATRGFLLVTGLECAPLLPPAAQLALAAALQPRARAGPVVSTSTESCASLLGRPGLQPALAVLLASAVSVELPPLRERAADLVELADVCCRRHAGLLGRTARRLDDSAAQALLSYHEQTPWPGNLAELDGLIAAAVAVAEGVEVTTADLRLPVTSTAPFRSYTIVSLDVADSTTMKRGQDRQSVQASFGAWHRLVEGLALRYRGEVYSESGDGTVLRFASADDAFGFSVALLDSLAAFNATENRLPMAFAVRIGLHTGEVPQTARAERSRLPSETIDLAAKLQQSAREGEVLVSATTYVALTNVSGLRPLRAPLAGLQVYSA